MCTSEYGLGCISMRQCDRIRPFSTPPNANDVLLVQQTAKDLRTNLRYLCLLGDVQGLSERCKSTYKMVHQLTILHKWCRGTQFEVADVAIVELQHAMEATAHWQHSSSYNAAAVAAPDWAQRLAHMKEAYMYYDSVNSDAATSMINDLDAKYSKAAAENRQRLRQLLHSPLNLPWPVVFELLWPHL